MINILLIKFILLVISVFTGYFGGYLLTEKYPLSKYDVFKFKAFECRPCLSFHIAWVTSTAISLQMCDLVMLVMGVIFALFLWWGLKVDQDEKTITIDENDL